MSDKNWSLEDIVTGPYMHKSGMDDATYSKNALKTECKIDAGTHKRAEKSRITIEKMLEQVSALSDRLDEHKKSIFYNKNTNCEYYAIGWVVKPPDLTTEQLRVLHHLIGLVGEVGELAKGLKSYFTNNEMDKVNFQEELGDCYYYLNGLVDCIDSNMPEIREKNIDKLSKRYPSGFFTEDDANNRNIENELAVYNK